MKKNKKVKEEKIIENESSNNEKKNVKTKTAKRDLTLYIVLRIFVILVMIRQIFTANWNNVFLCGLTLFLFTFPTLISKKLNVTVPNTLENIILIFIFASEILGEIHNFYGYFKNWDTILHTLNGFLCGAVGFALIDLLNRTERFHITLTPLFVAFVAFCFSMTIGVLWEFFEFGMDELCRTDMQKDEIISTISTVTLDETKTNSAIILKNIDSTEIHYTDKDGNPAVALIEGGYLDIGLKDTMHDMFVNFIGALSFSILGLLYIKDRDEYKFLEQFIPMMRKKSEEN